MNRRLFDELAKDHPNIGYIHTFLRSGANINALEQTGDSHLTAFWHMQRGLNKHNYNWDILHPFWCTVNIESKMAAFKAHFYPLLDILETYDFNIMNGASFRVAADGVKHLHMFAGFRLLDTTEFKIMACYDVPRLVQFFERMYFGKGHHVDDISITGIPYLSPLLWNEKRFYKPAVILYFIMKGAQWNNPAWRQPGYNARISNFADQVPADAAVDIIVGLQKQLGVNFITCPQGANLRGFLAAAYGTVVAVGILKKAVGLVSKARRDHILLHAPRLYA